MVITAWAVFEQIMEQDFELTLSTVVHAVAIGIILTVGFGLIGTWRVLADKAVPISIINDSGIHYDSHFDSIMKFLIRSVI